MLKISKIKSWIFVVILCVLITIYIAPVMADDNSKSTTTAATATTATTKKTLDPTTVPAANKSLSNADSSDPSCISCPDTQPVCPTCPQGVKCVLSIRTCHSCPQASCDIKSSTGGNDTSNSKSSGKNMLPAIIGGVVGGVVLIFACIGYFMLQRNSRKNKGTRLEETTSINSENVIPIAYIPPSTLKSPENSYQGTNSSHSTLIDITDDTSCEVGTILQATKTSPVTTTANTATVVTATRVKPALVRINTIKSINTSANSIRSGISTSPDPLLVDKSLLNTPSASSVQNSPATANIIVGNENAMSEVPRIDIERSSGELSRPSTRAAPSSRQHLNSPFLDPIEGRQSFGLFGSDEVYNTDPTVPQLQRESTVSSNSTNGRSTMFSDEGDGEITIFWGGNDTPFTPTAGTTTTAGEKVIDPKIEDPNKNVTNTKEENI